MRLDLLRGRVEVRETITLVNGSLNGGPTKSFETRSVPLPSFLREVLAAHLAARVAHVGTALRGDDFVFVGHQGGPLRSNQLHYVDYRICGVAVR